MSLISFRTTEDSDAITTVMCNSDLFIASMPDEDRREWRHGTWEPNLHNWTYLEVLQDDEVIGIVRYQSFSLVAVDIHYHILPQYWGTKISDKVHKELVKYLLKNTQYHKIILQSPRCCEHVIRAAHRNDFALEGVLKGATLWDGNIEDVVLMSKFIYGVEHG